MSNDTGRELLYKLNGRPPFKAAFPMGLQHVLAMFAGNLAPIFIIAAAVGVESGDMVLMIQCAMLASGVTTLVQLYPIKIGKIQIGGNLPIVMGTSFAFVGAASAVAALGKNAGLSSHDIMALVLAGAFFGAFAEIFLGVIYKYVKNVFTPLVVGSVLLTIGIGLLGVGADYFAGGSAAKGIDATTGNLMSYGSGLNLFLGFFTFFVVVLVQRFGTGMMKAAAILIGLVVGYIMAVICMFVGINFMGIAPENIAIIDFSSITSAGLISIPSPLHFGVSTLTTEAPLSVTINAIFLFIVVYFISGIETIGNTSGITVAAFDRKATSRETSGGLLADAFGSMFASLFNSLPNTAFGQNAGLVAMTKVINKWAIALGAFTLIAASFIPVLGAIFSSIPSAVLGGAVITVFAMIMMNGLKLIAKAGLDGRNGLIFAIIFGVGFGMGGNEAVIAGLPSWLHWIFEEQTAAVFIVSILATLALSEKGALKVDSSEEDEEPELHEAEK